MTAPTPAGTQRRIRALFALGWTNTSIEAATGVPADKLRRARLDRQSIQPDLAAPVAGAYEALWNREPPRQTAEQQGEANAARAYARRWGWAPPMGWDDDLIHDPAYRPPAREWKRTGERHVSALAIAEDAAFVREHGGYSHATDSEVALRLGVSKERLEKALERAQRYRSRTAETRAEPELEAS
jgi:hypothetical protein